MILLLRSSLLYQCGLFTEVVFIRGFTVQLRIIIRFITINNIAYVSRKLPNFDMKINFDKVVNFFPNHYLLSMAY